MADAQVRPFTLAKVVPDQVPEAVPTTPGLFGRVMKAIRRQPMDRPAERPYSSDPIPLETYVAMAGNLEKTPVTEFSLKFLRDMTYNSDLLALIVRTKTNESFRGGVSIEERFKSKCKTCGREFGEEKLICPFDQGEMIQPDYAQWKVLSQFLKIMNRWDESVMAVMREVDTDVHICDNGWVFLDRDYWFGDDGKITNEEVKSIIRFDPNMMRLIMSRYGMGTSETGAYAYFCVEHRNTVSEFADKGEHKCKCGKMMIPAWYCALTRAERFYYGPREIYHVKMYSNAQGYGVPPLMSCYMKVNTLLRMDKFILDAYTLQRSPQELLILRGKRDNIHRAWEWLMQKARENPNMVYPLVIEGDGGDGNKRVVEHETFALKPIEWEWHEMRDEFRKVVGAVYGVQPMFMGGDASGSGGLANEGLQIAVTTLAIKQEQHIWNTFLEFVSDQLMCPDYKFKLNPNEQEDEVRDLEVERKRLDMAVIMAQLGYNVELHEDSKGRMDFKYQEKPPAPLGEGLIPQEDVTTDTAKDYLEQDSMSPEQNRDERFGETRRAEEGPPQVGEAVSVGMGLGELQFDDDMIKVCEKCGGEAEVPNGMEKSYAQDRERTMRMIAGGDPHCDVEGCGEPANRLMIAHHKPDEFAGYASRSGGANYARWMVYVREHPSNYHLLCPKHHSQADERKIPGPEVHRKDVRVLQALAGVEKGSEKLDASWTRQVLRNHGIRLKPDESKGYVTCRVCGHDCGSLDGYVDHVEAKHPERVKKSNYVSKPVKSEKNPRGDENIPIETVQGATGMNLLESRPGSPG